MVLFRRQLIVPVFILMLQPSEAVRSGQLCTVNGLEQSSGQTTGSTANAERLCSEASKLLSQWREASARRAISKYEQARRDYRIGRKPAEEAGVLSSIGDIFLILGNYKKARSYQARALELSRSIGDRRVEIRALNKLGYLCVDSGLAQKALDYSNEARQLSRAAGDKSGEAQALDNAGLSYYATGDMPRALALFEQALVLWKEVDDRQGAAQTLNNVGYAYSNLGGIQKALNCHETALGLSESVNDRRTQALALTAIGGIRSWLGEKQEALNYHRQALQLLQTIGDRNGQAAAANGIGYVYDDLGEKSKALVFYRQALDLYTRAGNRNYAALSLGYIGRTLYALGNNATALRYFQHRLTLSRNLGDRRMEAYTHNYIGAVCESLKQTEAALRFYKQALTISIEMKDPRGQAYSMNRIGNIYRSQGDLQTALDYYNRALPLVRAVEDKRSETLTSYYISCVERDQQRFEEARSRIEEVIRTVESLRTKVASHEMRASYFASFHEYYEFYLDLLAQMHRKRPECGLDRLAFEVAERARARSLLDALSESGINIRLGVDRGLLTRERELQYRLNSKAEAQIRLLSGKHTPDQISAVKTELEDLWIQYQEVQAQVRDRSPRYAALTRPQILKVQDVQQQLLDSSSILLEYSLGEGHSYLWAVTQNDFAMYRLPGRAEIEVRARRLYTLLTARNVTTAAETSRDQAKRVEAADSQYLAAASSLSDLLLAPVAGLSSMKRVIVVADGALQYIPFAALTEPGWPNPNTPQPLMLSHEVVNLPSASALAALRSELDSRMPAPRSMAVLADPVFQKDDPRVGAGGRFDLATPLTRSARHYRRSSMKNSQAPDDPFDSREESVNLHRLPFAFQEAVDITSLVSTRDCLKAVGFDATRAAAMSSELSQYRIIHFATHALVNSENPALSGIVLCLVDRSGRPQKGFLTLDEIYNLNLPAELVVLSACRTALGKQIKGEGLVGLTRGFMYAGAARVVASLWNVDDRGSAELMRRFYEVMLSERLSPPAALRMAQVGMWEQKRWRSPYYWAPFIFQGELISMPR